MTTSTKAIEEFANQDYKYGFVTDVDADEIPKGLNEDVIRLISEKKDEPEWLLEWRLNAFAVWRTMNEPTWHNVHFKNVDFQDIIYYSAPKQRPKLDSLDDVDPEIRATFDKLGIPEAERKYLAGVGAQYDSEVVYHSVREDLEKLGVIFLDMDSGLREHEDLVREHFGTREPN